MKHWTQFLPDAGRIKDYGQDILLVQNVALKLKAEILKSEKEIEALEEDCFNCAHQDWTIDEITEAKQKAKEFNELN